jgi:sn-glycerol 3-phosphate transport system substrate-binding protein
VTVESPAADDYQTTFNNALLAAGQNDAPHVVQVEEGLTQLAIDSGLFIPVGELASEDQIAGLEDLIAPVRSYYNMGDTVWGIPWNSSNPVFYYNRDMFAAAGLDPDVSPATFADVTAACEALMASDLGLETCINWPMVAWFPEQWVAMQGGLIADNDNGRTARASEVFYDSPEMQAVVNWWSDLADRGFYSYTGSPNDYFGEGVAFLSQRSAMTINSSAGISNFLPFGERFLGPGVVEVAPLPIPNEDATNGVTVGGASVWITAGHPEPELQAAADFIFFLTNTENDMRWHMGSGYFPNRQSSIDALTEQGWFEENPFYYIPLQQLFNSEVNTATRGAVMGPSAMVRGFLIDAFISIVDGGADPLEALQVAKRRADEALAEYNSLVE